MTTVKHKTTGEICNVDSTYADRVKQQVTVYLKDRDGRQLAISLSDLMDNYEVVADEVERPETVWELKDGDRFWAIEGADAIEPHLWDGFEYHRTLRACGDAFLTREEAEKEVARRKAKQILLRDTRGFIPDPDDDYSHVDVYYSKNAGLDVAGDHGLDGGIYFRNYTDAHISIKAHEKEWKIYLEVEE